MIVAEFDAAGERGGAGAEDARDGRGDGFVGGEAVAALADVGAEALGVPVFEGREPPQPAVGGGPDFRAVGGPAHVGRGGGDATVVGLGRRGRRAMRGEEPVGAPQAQEAVAELLGRVKAAQNEIPADVQAREIADLREVVGDFEHAEIRGEFVSDDIHGIRQVDDLHGDAAAGHGLGGGATFNRFRSHFKRSEFNGL